MKRAGNRAKGAVVPRAVVAIQARFVHWIVKGEED